MIHLRQIDISHFRRKKKNAKKEKVTQNKRERYKKDEIN